MNDPRSALFDQFVQERRYLKNVTPRTIRWYQEAFKAYRATLPPDAGPVPSKATLQHFVINWQERGLKATSCNSRIIALNAFCAWLHQEGHLTESLKLKKLRVEQRVLALLNDQQMRALVSFKPRLFWEWRVHTAVCLALDTGLRVAELLALRRSDVDFDNLLLKVFGKGRKERMVPISVEMRRRLFRYEQMRARRSWQHDLLFATSRGTSWEKRNATHALHLLLAGLNLPKCGWHRLRHTFATNYLRQGGDIVRLSMVLGHSQITTTQRYLHLLTEDLSANHQRISILNRIG